MEFLSAGTALASASVCYGWSKVLNQANIVTDLSVSSVVSEATRVVGLSLSVVKVELRLEFVRVRLDVFRPLV